MDTCAEATLITEASARALNLKPTQVKASVSGVQGCSAGQANQAVDFELQFPRDDTFSLNLQALVLKKITSEIPNDKIVVRP